MDCMQQPKILINAHLKGAEEGSSYSLKCEVPDLGHLLNSDPKLCNFKVFFR